MPLRREDELLFVAVELTFRGNSLRLNRAMIDTGSVSTVVSAQVVTGIGLLPEPGDLLRRIRGVGGSEVVFIRRVEALAVGDVSVAGFEVEVGAMEYGIVMDALLGLDFLMAAGAKIDLAAMQLSFGP